MKKTKYIIFLAILLLVADQIALTRDRTADEIINKMQEKFNNSSMVQAKFVQTFHWTVAEETEQFVGEIYIGKKDAFRIQTPEQLIVSDGESVWTLDKVNHQVIIDHLDRSQEAFLPRQLFLRYQKDYRATLKGKEQVNGDLCYYLVLEPKKQDVYIQRLEVWVDQKEWVTRKISYLDINENTTTYYIKNIQLLDAYKSNLFQYEADSDIEVIDMR